MKKNICIAGKNSIVVAGLCYVLEKYHDQFQILALGDKNDDFTDKWQPSYLKYAKEQGVKILELEDLYNIDNLTFISLEYFKLIDPEKFKTDQLFNIHFSLLPAYRGMYTSAHPILNNEVETGCTIHEIDAGIDTGNIIAQTSFEIKNTDSCKEVYENYLKHGRSLVFSTIDSLIERTWKSYPHPTSGGSYYSMKSIDYSNLSVNTDCSSKELINQIRAYSFRDYQLPRVLGEDIYGYKQLNIRSLDDPGKIVENDLNFIQISTQDNDVVLYKDNFDLLMKAVREENLSEIRKLNQSNPFTLDEKDKNGWTPLIISLFNGLNKSTELLLELGADPEKTNPRGTTPLMYAKHYAEHTGDIFGMEAILSQNVDKQAEDIYRKSIYDYLDVSSAHNKKVSSLL